MRHWLVQIENNIPYEEQHLFDLGGFREDYFSLCEKKKGRTGSPEAHKWVFSYSQDASLLPQKCDDCVRLELLRELGE